MDIGSECGPSDSEAASGLSIFDNGSLIYTSVFPEDIGFYDSSDSQAYYGQAESDHTYVADGIAYLGYTSYYGTYPEEYFNYLGDAYATVTAPEVANGAPYISSISPDDATSGDSGEIEIFGQYLLNSDGSLPSFSDSPSGLHLTAESSSSQISPGAASANDHLYVSYTVDPGTIPDWGLIDVITDGGWSNDGGFQTYAPDAIIAVTPNPWTANGQPFPMVVYGSNVGNVAYIVIGPPWDITYSPFTFDALSNSYSTMVTVPTSETATQAVVTLTPGVTGCTGSCYTQAPTTPNGPPAGPAVGIAGINSVPAVSCTNQVTRGQTVTCTATGPSSSTFTNWTFSDGINTVGPSSGTSSNTWSGTAAESGTVSVQVNGATVSTQLSVVARSGWTTTAVEPVRVTVQQMQADINCTPVLVVNPPQSGLEVGQSCLDIEWGAHFLSIDSGPNSGFTIITAPPTDNTQYTWTMSADADDGNSTFYKAQCGNYNFSTNPTGFASGFTIDVDTQRHEAGSVNSHYMNYASALSANNLGRQLESLVVFTTDSAAMTASMTSTAQQVNSAVLSATNQEPCGTSTVTYSSSCQFDSYINYSPYAACQ